MKMLSCYSPASLIFKKKYGDMVRNNTGSFCAEWVICPCLQRSQGKKFKTKPTTVNSKGKHISQASCHVTWSRSPVLSQSQPPLLKHEENNKAALPPLRAVTKLR